MKPLEEMDERERALHAEVGEALSKLFSLFNGCSSSKAIAEYAMDAFVREHRTLQQNFVRTLVGMLTLWSREKKQFVADARNEASYEFACKVAEMDQYFPLI